MPQIKTMTPEDVSIKLRALGMRTSIERIRAGIISGAYPFGVSINVRSDNRTEFEIYETLFDKWVEERISK